MRLVGPVEQFQVLEAREQRTAAGQVQREPGEVDGGEAVQGGPADLDQRLLADPEPQEGARRVGVRPDLPQLPLGEHPGGDVEQGAAPVDEFDVDADRPVPGGGGDHALGVREADRDPGVVGQVGLAVVALAAVGAVLGERQRGRRDAEQPGRAQPDQDVPGGEVDPPRLVPEAGGAFLLDRREQVLPGLGVAQHVGARGDGGDRVGGTGRVGRAGCVGRVGRVGGLAGGSHASNLAGAARGPEGHGGLVRPEHFRIAADGL